MAVVDSQSSISLPDKEMLYVREVLHRISNEYTNAICFARRVAASTPTGPAKVAVEKIEQHLHVLAATHRALYPPAGDDMTDFADSLSALCRAMTSAWLMPEGVTLQLTADGPILLSQKICWKACLIISELIRNASSHASFSDRGRILVSITALSNRVLCRVSDDGTPVLTYVPGVGSRLVDALARELRGSVERHFGRSGATIVLSFPIDTVVSDRPVGGAPDCKNAHAYYNS